MRLGPTEGISKLLGVEAPWRIEDIDFLEERKEIKISITKAERKKLFHFQPSKTPQSCQWYHLKLGNYTTVIELKIDLEEFHELNLNTPKFLGRSNRTVTNALATQIFDASNSGLGESEVAIMTGLPTHVVEQEFKHIAAIKEGDVLKETLPEIADPIWESILKDKTRVKTKTLPLKLLLSKLKLEASKAGGQKLKLNQLANELRMFFLQNADILINEYTELFKKSDKKRASIETNELVVPDASSEIWPFLLKGDFKLVTHHPGLKFNITQQGKLYRVAQDPRHKEEIINFTYEFFLQNAESLDSEITQILTELDSRKTYKNLGSA